MATFFIVLVLLEIMRDQANNNDFYLINSYQYGSTGTVPTTEYATARSYMIKILMNRAILRLQIFITDMNVSVSILQILCIAAHVPVFFFFPVSLTFSLSLSISFLTLSRYRFLQYLFESVWRISIQSDLFSATLWIRIHILYLDPDPHS